MKDKVIALAAGRDHSLVLHEHSTLLGWGGDGTGRFPLPPGVCSVPAFEGAPVPIYGDAPLRQIAASAGLSLGLDANGCAYIWGANRAGLGGKLNSITQSHPSALRNLPALAQLSSSEFFSLARARDGSLYQWGLVPGAASSRNSRPELMRGIPLAKACCAGATHALLLDKAQRIWAWGANTAGQLGLGHLQDQLIPTRLPFAQRMLAVAAGATHNLAIDTRHRVWAWGSNQHGQLGDKLRPYSTEPSLVSLPEPATQIAAGLYVSYALGLSGQLYAWGWNAKGQLGQGHINALVGAQAIIGLPAQKLLAVGQGHVLASDGSQVWGWGDNRSGQLGSVKALEVRPVLLASAHQPTQLRQDPA